MTARALLSSLWPGSLLALPALLTACEYYPQRLPGPLAAPAASAAEPGPFTATVQRDSAPVWVRHPGERGAYALPFHRKRERLPIGAEVRTGAGGRAELSWSPDATALVLFEEGRVILGDPERDEPVMRLQSVTHAVLVLTAEDRVELPGGALLTGDTSTSAAGVLLEQKPRGILRITNQSRNLVSVRYLAERLELGPGESIDLPRLPAGAAPVESGAEPERVVAQGIELALQGRLQRVDDPLGVSLTAEEPSAVQALGVTARLAAQERARFSGLSQVPPAVPADALARP